MLCGTLSVYAIGLVKFSLTSGPVWSTSDVQVYLSKRIPPEAGLGGGSANAATALFAANELAGFPASLEDLQLWSAELGSDITFFLSTGTCYCTGRGEILHPQKPLPQSR